MTDDDDLDVRVGASDVVRRAYESLPIILGSVEGPDHRYIASNAAHRALLGHADVVGRTVLEVNPEWEGQHFLHLMDEVLRTGRTQRIPEWRIQMGPDAEGNYREAYVDATLVPRFGPDGEVVGVDSYTFDVTDRVGERLRAQREVVEAQDRYQRSHDMVLALQRALLPGGVPVLPEVELAASYLLADAHSAAGGDWFDALRLPDGRVGLVVGDVVGHGVDAAAAMGQLRSVLRDRLDEGAPIESVMAAGDRAATRIVGARSATVCIVVLDPADGTLSYVTAGHPPPLVVPARGEPRFLVPTGDRPLGAAIRASVRGDRLLPGDVLLLYTDGILERPGRDQAAGAAELAAVTTDVVRGRAMHRPQGTLAEDVCAQTLELLVRAGGHADDITLLAARLVTPPDDFVRELPAYASSIAETRRSLGAWLNAAGAPLPAVHALMHAVCELVTNVVQHAYVGEPTRGCVAVSAHLDAEGTVHVTVSDTGRWLERRRDDKRMHGLTMASELVDRIHVQPAEPGRAGTVATLSLRLARPPLLLEADELVTEPSIPPEHRNILLIMQHETDDGVRLVLDGPVDVSSEEALRQEIESSRLASSGTLLVDLARVTHLGSAGVALFHEALSPDAPGAAIRLYAPAASPAGQVLRLVSLPFETVDPEPVLSRRSAGPVTPRPSSPDPRPPHA